MSIHTTTIPASALHAAASLVVFAAARKEASMSPILGGVAVSVDAGEFVAVATDRYMVGEYRTAVEPDAAEFPAALIPSATLAQYAKGAPRTGYVTMTHDDDTHTLALEFNGNTLRGYTVTGNIPPVGRLLDGEASELYGTPMLNPVFLAKLAKIKHPGTGKLDGRNDTWTFERQAAERDRRPEHLDRTPLRMSVAFDTVHRFRVMLQPNYAVR